MLGIVVLLLNRDRISARTLAEKFDVSVRTIYRDIESINLAGIPIVSYQGSSGGIGIMDNYRLNRQVLTLDEMKSIITALKGINTTLGDVEIDTVAEKILALVPRDKVENFSRHIDELAIDFIPWGYKERTKEYLKLIQQAISERMIIDFRYMNAKHESTPRQVEPMTLVFKGYAWYLFAYCRLRHDYRIFRLSRMNDLCVHDEKFERKEQSYRNFIDQAAPEKDLICLRMKFHPAIKMKVEECFNEECIEYLPDGHLLVTLSVPEDEWVYSMILSFGEYAELLEPGHIKSAITEKIKKMSQIYNYDIVLSQ